MPPSPWFHRLCSPKMNGPWKIFFLLIFVVVPMWFQDGVKCALKYDFLLKHWGPKCLSPFYFYLWNCRLSKRLKIGLESRPSWLDYPIIQYTSAGKSFIKSGDKKNWKSRKIKVWTRGQGGVIVLLATPTLTISPTPKIHTWVFCNGEGGFHKGLEARLLNQGLIKIRLAQYQYWIW